MPAPRAGSDEERGRPVLIVRNLIKRFPGILALDSIDFDLRAGEVHAVLGENGAGKSTLMHILYGLIRPDAGEMMLWGRRYAPSSPRDAVVSGVGMVHQHFLLIPALTVAQNVVLGDEPRRGPLIDLRAAEDRIDRLRTAYGIEVDPTALVADLSVGMRQRVEVLKALYRDARLLILDEPTALLTPQETRHLFRAIQELTARGISVIFISHKLDEVRLVSQRVTVLRRGRAVGTERSTEITPGELARRMTGHEVTMSFRRQASSAGEPLLRIEELSAQGTGPLTLDLCAGEILGVAGIEGNGQEALIGALAGLIPARGKVWLGGARIDHLTVRQRVEAGLGLVPSDRQEDGLVLPMTAAENLALRSYYRRPYARWGMLDLAQWSRETPGKLKAFDVRPPSGGVKAEALSGGNQQKLVLAREIGAEPRVLIASQPTRGLDVGATEFVHRRLIGLRDSGRGILLVSFDLDEVLALSDRIAVLSRGRIAGLMPRREADREALGLLMMGAPPRGPAS